MPSPARIAGNLLLVISILLSCQVVAHNAFMSFYKVKQEAQHLSLTVVLATSSVEQTMKTTYLHRPYQQQTESQKKQWLIDYITENTKIWLNDSLSVLKVKAINWGAHETQVQFEMGINSDHASEVLSSIDFHITGFAKSQNHHNIVLLDAPGFPNKAVLSHVNQFRTKVDRL
jgi:hypothetical protein